LNDELDKQLVEDTKAGLLTTLDLFTLNGFGRLTSSAEKASTAIASKARGAIPGKPTLEKLTPTFAKEARARNFPKSQQELEEAMVKSFKTSFLLQIFLKPLLQYFQKPHQPFRQSYVSALTIRFA